MIIEKFGQTTEGKEVIRYTLKNKKQMRVSIMDLGATIVAVEVPDRNGELCDVVLGYDSAKEYEEHTYYFGAVIGRNANRIEGAKCTIEGVEYSLEANNNENNLHSGSEGLHSKLWNAEWEEEKENEITFVYVSPEKEQGFPGNMTVKVHYTVTEENELIIHYEAVSDQTTIANFTNHSYFNLDGHASGSIENHNLQIVASAYTPMKDANSIPTGELASVVGTPLDFTSSKRIGEEIESPFEQIQFARGYDHNYVLHTERPEVPQLTASAYSEESGIAMDVYTDCVGVQLYTGNFIEDHTGKNNVTYHARQGFCLETQYFPNAINEPAFLSPIVKAGEVYHSETRYCFTIKEQ